MQLLLSALLFYFISSSTSYRRPHKVLKLDLHNQNASSLELNAESICKCKRIHTTLNIFNSSLPVLKSRLLENCPTLDVLNVSNNKIVEVKNDTFEILTNLGALDLSFNQLITLPKDVFKPLAYLLTLNLEGNQIQIIDSNLFFHNKYLAFIQINNNNLNLIQPKSFLNNLYLFFLNVSGNRNLSNIDLFPDDRHQQFELRLSDCGLTQLYIPKNVLKIDARFNKINSITAHPESLLHELEINNNNFTNLERLPPLKKLWRLWADQNPKQNISAAYIKTILPKLHSIFIDSPGIDNDQLKRILFDFERNYIDVNINYKSIDLYLDEITEEEEEC